MAISSNISVIEHLDWQGYSGLILSSRIKEIVSLRAMDDLRVANSSFGRVIGGSFIFEGDELTVFDSKFQHIMTNGMRIRTGRALFNNTVFNTLSKKAINVTPGGRLSLHNVNIVKCEKPCIIVPYSTAVEFNNVTVGNETVTVNSWVLVYSEYDKSTAVARELTNYTQCSSVNDEITCDFTNFSEVRI